MDIDIKKIDAMKIYKPLLPASLKGGAATAIVDPPWPVMQQGKLGAINHYKLMTLEQIKALPVGSLCAENAHCWLWVTNATMEEGFKVLRAWGFEPRSIFTWFKPRLGLGVYLRNCTEHCILATRGKMPVKVKNQPNAGIFQYKTTAINQRSSMILWNAFLPARIWSCLPAAPVTAGRFGGTRFHPTWLFPDSRCQSTAIPC